MKVLSVFGTRPAAIKFAPILHALEADRRFDSILCVTAQHRHMLDQMLKQFELVPDIDLNIMSHDQDLFDITHQILTQLRATLKAIKPNWILVQGDTTTCFTTSLAAFYSDIPIGHVEAGLRTYNPKAPYPEEMNRSLVSRIANLHFSPTQTSKNNLLREQIDEAKIFVTGNTIIDALHWMKNKNGHHLNLHEELSELTPILSSGAPIILVTGHRRETFGSGLGAICQAIKKMAIDHPDWQFIYPIHLNPNVQTQVKNLISGISNVHLLEPLSYAPFVTLLSKAKLVITDSGGLQEEAPSLGKPVLLTRQVTGRPEGIEAGTAILVGHCQDTIMKEVESLMTDQARYHKMSQAHNPYGDGNAAQRIVNILAEQLK